MTDPNPNPFADCDVIVCYGGAKLTDEHLASTVHCVDDEIIEWLKRREQRRGDRPQAPRTNTLPRSRLACSWQSVYKQLP